MSKENESISEIKEELLKVHQKLDQLILSVEKLHKNSIRMDNHIGFIEDTYSSIRNPLNYIKRKFEGFSGVESDQDLPDAPKNQLTLKD